MKRYSSYGVFLLFILTIAIVFQACAKKQIKEGKTIEEMDVGAEGGMGPVEIGHAGGMQRVHFEYDKYRLTDETREVLRQNADWLKKHKKIAVQVEGHCDTRGTQEYNLALGQKRADAVRSYLVDLGINSDRLTTISYGEERPLDSEESESAWAKNRRAQFVITRK